MIDNTDIKLNYDDISIVPEVLTDIDTRKKCNPYDKNGMLPIIASGMSSVVSTGNASKFLCEYIYSVIPRTYSIKTRLEYLAKYINRHRYFFVAFSMDEAYDLFVKDAYRAPEYVSMDMANTIKDSVKHICIDLANGHMKKLLECVRAIKDKWGDGMVIMTGNIANPETYEEYEKAGADYVRCSIGTGDCCSTASVTGVFYPPFSLIMETYRIKQKISGKCKIIADGGIKTLRDIQKALLYADYVMIGSLFNKAMESAGKTTYGKSYWRIFGHKVMRPLKTLLTYGREVAVKNYGKAYEKVAAGKLDVWKEVYGMSTQKAQIEINEARGVNGRLKSSEGIVKRQRVEYTLHEWAEAERDALKSAMSYTNSFNLEEFKDSLWVRQNSIKYNK